ncbi:hypothetical protein [Phenylobacterium sp.]|jgi:hypothetical protein|uniref:hypothetical protein n=1 Tax=Phenylobacterium sp. TaxID=1871053 RepID=UPI002E3306E2|nr:hypothetical protein [Phenylobacterium sp.]HEX2562136.1 hypothetical protein [Phenylobacterium sp.]
MSVESRKIEGAFTPGYWTVQVRLRDEAQGPRYLCHATSDRQARGLALSLSKAHADSRGYAYHRLSAEPPSPLPALGEVIEIMSGHIWRQLLALRVGYDRLDPQSD